MPQEIQKICGWYYCILEKPGHLQQFAACTNIQHPNNRYSVETEKNGALPFADINI